MRPIQRGVFLAACSWALWVPTKAVIAKGPEPPVARTEARALVAHGDTRIDDYYWLRDRNDPNVVEYLEAENAYTDAVMAHTEALRKTLFDEIVGRIEPDDTSVPYRKGDYLYYHRYEAGKDYKIHCRRKGSMEAPEEILLDGNALGEGHAFFSLVPVGVSPDQGLLAFATDTVGRRFYTLGFKDLESGRMLDDVLPDVVGNAVWANDSRTVLYVKQHPETLRWYRVYRHVLGTDTDQDALVYEETDDTFSVFVSKTRSEKYLTIVSHHTLATEYRLLDADEPRGELQVFEPRQMGHEYDVAHRGDTFLVRTNLEARNFRLVQTPVTATGREHWKEVVPHRGHVFLAGVEVFEDYTVLTERKDGLIRMRVLPEQGQETREIDFGEPAYDAWVDQNPEFDTRALRYGYTSLTTPRSIYDYDMASGEKALLKREKVGGGYDPAEYTSERLYARARDGVAVPISLVYRTGLKRDGSSPLLLYAYGSYGYSTDASFASDRLSLLDRGFIFAIAHVRGGQELGREWYEDGKLLEKKNTFTDFVDCASHLVQQRYTSPDRLFAEGGSAGGLLMGAITNMRPDLFKGVICAVPFVDVVTTMLDASIPLTSSEWDEWGDPRKKEYYDYMLSYSPYDNIEAKDYPNILVTTSLHDSQVQYWEPAKYVARLRATKTDANRLLLKTDMAAGHGGKTGRFKAHEDTAFAYAFMLDLAGITE
ncbi:MAG: S9 family peptidase [Acidobacteria bacterium]|nr:S9 family peptidase [Acidobacteriota bacterium]